MTRTFANLRDGWDSRGRFLGSHTLIPLKRVERDIDIERLADNRPVPSQPSQDLRGPRLEGVPVTVLSSPERLPRGVVWSLRPEALSIPGASEQTRREPPPTTNPRRTMTTETSTPTTEQRHARLILNRLAHRGPATLREVAGNGVPRPDTQAFGAAFALLTRGGLVTYVGDGPGPTRARVPLFAATNDGHALARHLPPEVR